jgi:hypothetical protein
LVAQFHVVTEYSEQSEECPEANLQDQAYWKNQCNYCLIQIAAVKALGNQLAKLVYNPLKIVAQLNHSIHVIAFFFIFLVLPFLFAIPALSAAAIGLQRGITLRTRSAFLSAHRASKDHQ